MCSVVLSKFGARPWTQFWFQVGFSFWLVSVSVLVSVLVPVSVLLSDFERVLRLLVCAV